MTVWACLLLGCDAGSAAPDTLVLSNRAVGRFGRAFECPNCVSWDVADGVPAGPFRTLIIDGHSLPPHQVIGIESARIAEFVSAVGPSSVLLDTCYGAELQLLTSIFNASPRVEQVLAAASTLPWTAIELSPNCLATDTLLAECANAWRGVNRYTRTDVRALDVAGENLRDSVRGCATLPELVRVRPRYACVDRAGLPPAILHLREQDVCPTWAPGEVRIVPSSRCDSAHDDLDVLEHPGDG